MVMVDVGFVWRMPFRKKKHLDNLMAVIIGMSLVCSGRILNRTDH